MLIGFATKNYRSIDDALVFSMRASADVAHPSHVKSVKGQELLKGSFIFGANASGKSNFIDAIAFAKYFVTIGLLPNDGGRRYFRIKNSNAHTPGVFQFEFTYGENVYSYGFAVRYDTSEVVEEWLYHRTGNTKKAVFHRQLNQNGEVEIVSEFLRSITQEDANRFTVYQEDFKNITNLHLRQTLFLRDVALRGNKGSQFFMHFVNAYAFISSMVIITPENHYNGLGNLATDGRQRENFERILSSFDTGIENIEGIAVDFDKVLANLPPSVVETERSFIMRTVTQYPQTFNIGGQLFELNKELDGSIIAKKMFLNHGNMDEYFTCEDESDGTRRLFDLIPLFLLPDKNVPVIIDEIDRSLHTKLARQFVEKFYNLNSDNEMQLVCTTHDSNFLDLNLVRRDEIWFVERELNHSSRLYPLSDYKTKMSDNIQHDYLLGRYGSIPLFKEW